MKGMSIFTSTEKIDDAISKCETVQDKADLLSLRNSLFLFKALTKERHREVYISLKGFDSFKESYEHYLLDS